MSSDFMSSAPVTLIAFSDTVKNNSPSFKSHFIPISLYRIEFCARKWTQNERSSKIYILFFLKGNEDGFFKSLIIVKSTPRLIINNLKIKNFQQPKTLIPFFKKKYINFGATLILRPVSCTELNSIQGDGTMGIFFKKNSFFRKFFREKKSI